MKKNAGKKEYQLTEVHIRLTEGHVLYSKRAMKTPEAAVDVMREELASYDREVFCVLNLTSKLQPINYHIVSVGDINSTLIAIPNLLKSCLLSNAAYFLLLHNHPSGDVMPSKADIEATKQVIEAGKILNIPCIDHIIVGGGKKNYLSLRVSGQVDFDR